MIYNDSLPKSYGGFEEISTSSTLLMSKAKPKDTDYKEGYVERFFAKRVNENKIYEIDYLNSKNTTNALYKIVSVKWKISGPKHNVIVNGILDKAGVTEQNRFEIDRIKKEEGIDLSSTLPNLLEYWRGF